MKQPIAIRVDAGPLAMVWDCARRDDRTPTDVIETVPRRHVEERAGQTPEPRSAMRKGYEA